MKHRSFEAPASSKARKGTTIMKRGLLLGLALLLVPMPAYAWGANGHKIITAIAKSYLSPKALAKIDALLAEDSDPLTAPDMFSRSTWADAWRTDHRETANWHFADIELDDPDLDKACFGFPPSTGTASSGPADDCILNKITEFAAELASPAT